ncbi:MULTISPECIES: hypothetical protein [Pantoea]|uniref:hypothetical protein n=1 Tax=Pantoea TaxID=53335 RepID=UPI001F47B2BC|nr:MULTISPECIES: hypothetical protein [Pantoea]UIL52025.1 hypothetical protein LZU96_17685 [Pantoea agglomerans]
MKWLIIVVLTLFAVACASGNPQSAEQVLSDKVLTASMNNDNSPLSDVDYDQISEYLSQGRPRWIALYPILNQSPFLGITSFQEGLNISMAYALPENPEEVLKFVNENNINSICGLPFIEPTQNETEAYFILTSAALNKLPTGGYWQKRCLAVLKKRYAGQKGEVRPEDGSSQQ